VRVDQTTNPRFSICQSPIQSYIFERNCCLRRKHFKHGKTVRRENLRCQIVFKVENADESSLVDQWESQDGTGATLSDIRIGGKRILRRCIIENHGLTRAQNIPNEGLWQRGRNGCITFPHVNGYFVSLRSCFRVYQQFVTS